MRKFLMLFCGLFSASAALHAQCNTSNATSCLCADGSGNCDLLPDITVSAYSIQTYAGGPEEFSQTGNGADNGKLKLSVSSPNIGHGPLTVGALNQWVCGTDTFTTNPGLCSDGSQPRQLIKQKIYHKNGNAMSYYERYAGAMTYHPTHGHMHTDNWEVMTLRIQDPNEPDPRNWPIVGTGAKLGFCLMDYYSCTDPSANGHCRDAAGNILNQTSQLPNYGLGGGNYGCSPVEQGISAGYTDVYSKNLDEMWIIIPPGTCNGDYYVVVEADPYNYYLEENEDNNWAVIPVTLTQQVPAGAGMAQITYSGATTLCQGATVTLSANAGSTYLWSTGETTQAINVSNPGNYSVTVTSACGTATSQPLSLNFLNPSSPTASDATVCSGHAATLSASGTGDIQWYDNATATTALATGASFQTPILSNSTTYYSSQIETTVGAITYGGPLDGSIGTGANHTSNTRYLTFDVQQAATLKSVWVQASTAGNRTIELRNSNNNILQTTTVNIPAGQSRVILNFPLSAGLDYRLGLGANSAADLYRNNGGVLYPYQISDKVTITNSSAGVDYYYFFYDWEIQAPSTVCESPRIPVLVSVNPTVEITNPYSICANDSIFLAGAWQHNAGTYTETFTSALGCDSLIHSVLAVNPLPSVSFSGLNFASYPSNGASVTLVGNPSGGTFSGTGVQGNSFDPQAAGIGGPYDITYSYSDANGCTNSNTQQVSVYDVVSIGNVWEEMDLTIFPNPNSGIFTLKLLAKQTSDLKIRVLNLSGQSIWEQTQKQISGVFTQKIQLGSQAAGIYFVEVEMEGKVARTKIVVE